MTYTEAYEQFCKVLDLLESKGFLKKYYIPQLNAVKNLLKKLAQSEQ